MSDDTPAPGASPRPEPLTEERKRYARERDARKMMRTETPWRSGGCVVWGGDGDLVADLARTCGRRTPDQVEANVEFIVDAVNDRAAHLALLRRAETALAADCHHEPEPGSKTGTCELCQLVRDLRTALAGADK